MEGLGLAVWGSTHHQLGPGGECLDVGAVVVLVHLAQDGSHAGHVVTLEERGWSGPHSWHHRVHWGPEGPRICPCSSSWSVPQSPNCPGGPSPSACHSSALQTSPAAPLSPGSCSQPFLSSPCGDAGEDADITI